MLEMMVKKYRKENIMKFLIKKSPDGFIKSVNDEISSILNRNFDSLFPEYIFNEELEGNAKYAMPVELHEKDKEYSVKAELPGIKKDDLDIDIDKNHITINAKKEEEKKEDTKGYRKSEFNYGEFSRTVYFPQDIDIEKTSATLENGVLNIIAPKVAVEKEHIKKLTVS
jgi:HSP20 family protein